MAHGSAGRSSLSRILQLLDAFDVDAPFLTISQLARRSGMSLSSAHRLVGELEHHGIVERRDDRTYRLGIRLWQLASRTPGALGLREIAMPHLLEIHNVVRQHIQFGVLDGHHVLFLERLSMKDAVVNITTIGGRLPLHGSSSGLVLLAFASLELQEDIARGPLESFTDMTISTPDQLRLTLARIRTERYVVQDGALHPDARGIAVPVFGPERSVVAALSAIVPNDSTPWPGIVRALSVTAARISDSLEHAYLPSTDPRASAGGRFRPLVHSSTSSMEYLSSPEYLGSAKGKVDSHVPGAR